MLSRVANGLYWMSRYVERAENTARLVDVNLQLMLNVRSLNETALKGYWKPIVKSTGDEELFSQLYPKVSGQNVSEFFVFQTLNPNSVVSCIGHAREAARTVRDQITVEFWEVLNRLYLFVNSPAARRMWENGPDELFNEIRNTSLLLQGLADATVVRNEGWLFIQAGRYIERADKTSRMLDVRHESATSQSDALGWSAMLRSCSAWDAYKALHGADVRPRLVAEFLMLSADFPRSARFCIEQLNRALRAISGVPTGRYSNDADKLSGRLLSELQYSSVDDVFKPDLHSYIDQFQANLNDIGDALFRAYIFQPFDNGTEAIWRQQEEQQQQSAGAAPRLQ